MTLYHRRGYAPTLTWQTSQGQILVSRASGYNRIGLTIVSELSRDQRKTIPKVRDVMMLIEADG
jgi:hypothetical protein